MDSYRERLKELYEENRRRYEDLQKRKFKSSKYPRGHPKRFSRKTMGILNELMPIMWDQLKMMEIIIEVMEGRALI